MGSGSLFKWVKESIIILLLVTGIAYAVLYFTKGAERLLPAKPTTQIYVQDKANLLSTTEEEKLEKSCENLYHNMGVQLVFLTVDSIPSSYTLEEYASAVLKKWGIGDEATGNGLLFIYDKKDEKTRLEVGYGMDEDRLDFEGKLILLEAKSSILEGKTYKAFDTVVSKITKIRNGTSEVHGEQVLKNIGKSTTNITRGTDDSITAVSNDRADIIGFILGFSIIIILLIRSRFKSRKSIHNTHDKYTNTIPVAYRSNYYEDYGDDDHIFL